MMPQQTNKQQADAMVIGNTAHGYLCTLHLRRPLATLPLTLHRELHLRKLYPMVLEQVLAPRHQPYQSRELRLLPLAHRLENRGVELPGRLRALCGGQQLGNVRRRARSGSGSGSSARTNANANARTSRVECQKCHRPLELAQKVRVFLAPWGQLRRGKVERFVRPAMSDVLD